MTNESDADCDVSFRLSIAPFCRILELVDLVCTPRLRTLRKRIITARRDAFEASDWDKHAYLIQVLGYQESRIRDEALAYVLYKLDIAFEIFQRTYEYITVNKD